GSLQPAASRRGRSRIPDRPRRPVRDRRTDRHGLPERVGPRASGGPAGHRFRTRNAGPIARGGRVDRPLGSVSGARDVSPHDRGLLRVKKRKKPSQTRKALWGGGFEADPGMALARLSISHPFDRRLAKADLAGSLAHARGLARVRLVSKAELL